MYDDISLILRPSLSFLLLAVWLSVLQATENWVRASEQGYDDINKMTSLCALNVASKTSNECQSMHLSTSRLVCNTSSWKYMIGYFAGVGNKTTFLID